MARILLIDDEPDILVLVKKTLQKDGHLVTATESPEKLELSNLNRFDLILLDVMMPGTDGFTFCQRVRDIVDCPILFLTAKTMESDVICGFGLGADDYIKKPFGTGELRARVNAHLRRENREKRNILIVSGLEFYLAAKEVSVNEQKIPFTKKEYDICEFLAKNRGQVFSKDQIYDAICGYDAEGDSFTVAVHIKNIRAKLAVYHMAPILTVWGIGYKWETIQSGRRTSGVSLITGLNTECYFPIERRDEICIVEYSALSQFSAEFLREHLPSPEIILFWTILATFLTEIFLLSKFYGKRISRKLLPLQKATDKIQNKDLEFEIQYSGINEIDFALQSLDSMKAELKRSLETQWKMEQTRKTQISALAHDLKTPLTVVRGNAEIMDDTEQTEEQKECTRYILKNADQIEQYVLMLIKLSKAEAGYSLQLENVNMKTFLDDIYSQINALASVKHLKVEFDEKDLPDTINLDISLTQRAIMNIVANAADCSPERGMIRFAVSVNKNKIRFITTDSGKGFTREDLKNAKMQFYQSDSSRSSKLHYGMGLFIADSIVKQHGGTLIVANSPVTGGGMVTIEVEALR